MECPYLETDEFGDICHADIGEECLNPFNCSAVYDSCGNLLQAAESGMDRETGGIYD